MRLVLPDACSAKSFVEASFSNEISFSLRALIFLEEEDGDASRARSLPFIFLLLRLIEKHTLWYLDLLFWYEIRFKGACLQHMDKTVL